ncbi:hypothetical protein NMG60_11000725 [Bertholletia excelsa]
MDRRDSGFLLMLYIVVAIGVASFVLCIASELKRTKRKDLKMDGKLCYLPESRAFGYGAAALICLFLAQIVGSVILCRSVCSGEDRSCRRTAGSSFLLFLSWIMFGITVILISVATSMNTRQPYGEGWLDGECYLVKDGVFAGSAVLVVATVSSTVASAIMARKKSQLISDQKCDLCQIERRN